MLNKVILQGRFVETPEEKITQSGVTVTSFRFASNGNASVIFINCVAWRGTAEHICRYFKKGKEAVIVGRLTQRTYGEGERKRTETEITVDEINFVGTKEQDDDTYVFTNEASPSFEEISGEEDLPF